MEKLTCTACGATMTPNTVQPYLVCEYCDSAIENKYYDAAAAEAARLEAARQEALQAADQSSGEDAAEASAEEPTLVERILNAGKEKLTDKIEQLTGLELDGKPEAVVYTQPVVYSQPVAYSQPLLYSQTAARPMPTVPRRDERRRKEPVQQPRPVHMARHGRHGEAGRQGMQQRPDNGRGQNSPGGRGQGGRKQNSPGGR